MNIFARISSRTGAGKGGKLLLSEHLHTGTLQEHNDEDDGCHGEDNQGELPGVPADGSKFFVRIRHAHVHG
jgi:hypothetical protein